MDRTLTLKTEENMEALGERIARALPQGGFVALCGDLGAGRPSSAGARADRWASIT